MPIEAICLSMRVSSPGMMSHMTVWPLAEAKAMSRGRLRPTVTLTPMVADPPTVRMAGRRVAARAMARVVVGVAVGDVAVVAARVHRKVKAGKVALVARMHATSPTAMAETAAVVAAAGVTTTPKTNAINPAHRGHKVKLVEIVPRPHQQQTAHPAPPT